MERILFTNIEAADMLGINPELSDEAKTIAIDELVEKEYLPACVIFGEVRYSRTAIEECAETLTQLTATRMADLEDGVTITADSDDLHISTVE